MNIIEGLLAVIVALLALLAMKDTNKICYPGPLTDVFPDCIPYHKKNFYNYTAKKGCMGGDIPVFQNKSYKKLLINMDNTDTYQEEICYMFSCNAKSKTPYYEKIYIKPIWNVSYTKFFHYEDEDKYNCINKKPLQCTLPGYHLKILNMQKKIAYDPDTYGLYNRLMCRYDIYCSYRPLLVI